MCISADLLNHHSHVIPKMHIHSHGAECQLKFNLNWLCWSVHSDLKDPEH